MRRLCVITYLTQEFGFTPFRMLCHYSEPNSKRQRYQTVAKRVEPAKQLMKPPILLVE